MDKQTLNEMQEDYLKELINVSFGLAASIIGDMLHAKARLDIPKVGIYPISKLYDVISKKIVGHEDGIMLIKQFFQSFVNGDAYFLLQKDDAKKLACMLFQKDDVTAQEMECIAMELTNILTSVCIGQIAQMSKTRTIFLPPEIIKHERLFDQTGNELKGFTQFILVETMLNLEQEGISGQMLILIGEGVLKIILSQMPLSD